MPTGTGLTPSERALSHVGSPPDTGTTDVPQGMPARKELILTGRASLVDLSRNPDDYVDADTDRELWEGIPRNTRDTIAWAWGRWIWWCGKTSRQHCPATPGSVRQYIRDHWYMAGPDGKLRGRYGQPYAPATVETAVYLVSTVHQWKGWASPVKHPLVERQLKRYRDKFEEAGFRPDVADPLTHSQSVALARSCDLATVAGLRLATMMRLQFDTGARASEICHIQLGDLQWERDDDTGDERVVVTISRAKVGGAAGARLVGVEATPDVDGDVDPALLVRRLVDVLAAAGITDGPLFRLVHSAPRRADYDASGVMSGVWLDVEMDRRAYAAAFDRAVVRSGIALDPVTGRRVYHFTTQSNRSGLVTRAAEARMPLEWVARRTGHSPASPVIHRYFRTGRSWGDANAGTLIRLARRPGSGGDVG